MITRRHLDIENGRGQRLRATLQLPADGQPESYALFAHCFTCSRRLHASRHVVDALTLQGVGVLSFDFTGLGESEGEFEGTGFCSNVEDVVAVARYMAEEWEAPTLLVGHSLGGTAMLHAARRIPAVRAVASIAAPYDAAHLGRLVDDAQRAEIEAHGATEVSLGGRPFRLGRAFLEDLDRADSAEAIRELGAALLVIHSPVDREVSIDEASKIFVAARHPKSFLSLDRADHLLSDEHEARYVGEVIGSWSRKYVRQHADRPASPSPSLEAADAEVVTRTMAGSFRTEVLAGSHSFLADEPPSVGGEDQGPNPYELLLAALGACTTMTLKMYADRKGWPMDEAIVRLRHEKRPDEQGNKVDHIERRLEVVGDLSEEQRERLLQISERCPVHRTLHSPITVTSKLDGRGKSVDDGA